ncbi:hypothetical protein [Epilithonimonas caeni]|uniref:hypothetical protein n=1 Tax=Epilithonimonas caeni TaxID=365343 RepID=UPI000484047F|nr:hypothetical protein [Epilithonimonas caeni]
MKNLFIVLSGIILLISCEKNDGKQSHVENRKPDTLAIPNQEKNVIPEAENVDYCYLNVLAKDSMFMTYRVTNGIVKGKLKYKNFEKDSSFGEITGTISADTLKVNYKFVSEGVTSEREIYFLQDSGVLLEGIGNYADNNSAKLVYRSPKAINYSTGRRLNPVDCKSIK